MKEILFGVLALLLVACRKEPESLTAQQIVDKAIEVSGGPLYAKSNIAFEFRDRKYILEREGRRVMKRITRTDSALITDIQGPSGFQRLVNGQNVRVSDSMARRYGNSINSVHYFAYLPYGLNDRAVKKKMLGEEILRDKVYYKIEVTFEREGGGDDFEDVYVYWFNKKTFKPDFLAYEFHVDGGGMRFREALNERYVNGIRFVDYNNYKPRTDEVSLYDTGQLFTEGKLELLSKIALKDISVTSGNYN